MYVACLTCRAHNVWGRMSKQCWSIILTTILTHKEPVILKTGSLWYKQVQQNQDVPVHCTELSFALFYLFNLCLFSQPGSMGDSFFLPVLQVSAKAYQAGCAPSIPSCLPYCGRGTRGSTPGSPWSHEILSIDGLCCWAEKAEELKSK